MSERLSVQSRPPKCETSKPFAAMVLSCIDPRIIDQVHYYIDVESKLRCNYSQFVIAGAAVGVVAPKFRNWHETFWENLSESIKLHGIEKVIAIDHRDCSAAKIAYPDVDFRNPAKEKEAHEKVMTAFREEVKKRHRGLTVVTLLMDLNGDVETLK
ncbi:MAG TPA: carbonic anhydrase [Candidatus Angelobacter sp.]